MRVLYGLGFAGGFAIAWAFAALLVQAYAIAFFEPITWRASFGVALLISAWLAHQAGGREVKKWVPPLPSPALPPLEPPDVPDDVHTWH